MKAEEFRYGNIISLDNDLMEIRLIRQLSLGLIRTNNFVFNPIIIRPFIFLRPVKLSHDLLIKIGFKFHDKTYSADFSEYLYKNKFLVIHNKKGFFAYCSDKKLKYLHELQNSYYINTNKELNINKLFFK